MKGPRVTLTNGKYEFRVPAGGVLSLADPPEAGWVMKDPAAPRIGRQPVLPTRDRRPGCAAVIPGRGARR